MGRRGQAVRAGRMQRGTLLLLGTYQRQTMDNKRIHLMVAKVQERWSLRVGLRLRFHWHCGSASAKHAVKCQWTIPQMWEGGVGCEVWVRVCAKNPLAVIKRKIAQWLYLQYISGTMEDTGCRQRLAGWLAGWQEESWRLSDWKTKGLNGRHTHNAHTHTRAHRLMRSTPVQRGRGPLPTCKTDKTVTRSSQFSWLEISAQQRGLLRKLARNRLGWYIK